MRERIQALWDELADFELPDSDAALVHALSTFGALVRAREAAWCGVVRLGHRSHDLLGGWRVRARRTTTVARGRLPLRGSPGEEVRLLGRCLGDVSLGRRTVCAARMNAQTICVAFRVTAELSSSFFWHAHPRATFTAPDCDLLAYAMRGLKWFRRQILVSHGFEAARVPFTAEELAVLPLVLENLAVAAIAERRSISRAVVQVHVRAIAQKVGVAGRVDLLSLWNGPPPAN